MTKKWHAGFAPHRPFKIWVSWWNNEDLTFPNGVHVWLGFWLFTVWSYYE